MGTREPGVIRRHVKTAGLWLGNGPQGQLESEPSHTLSEVAASVTFSTAENFEFDFLIF